MPDTHTGVFSNGEPPQMKILQATEKKESEGTKCDHTDISQGICSLSHDLLSLVELLCGLKTENMAYMQIRYWGQKKTVL
jgi:hypothetical protein